MEDKEGDRVETEQTNAFAERERVQENVENDRFPDLCDALIQEFVGRVGAIVAPHLRASIASVIAGRHRFSDCRQASLQ